MIEITMAMQQENVIELLDHYEEDGVTFDYKEKKGIKLYFETNAEDIEKACKIAKAAIKAQTWGSVLYFQAVPVK